MKLMVLLCAWLAAASTFGAAKVRLVYGESWSPAGLAGLGDYSCPPSGVMAIWNALSCPKRVRWVQGSTHGYVPKQPNDEIIVEKE